MILLWFTAGVVPAVLLGVYLPWSAWVLPVGLGSLAAGFLFKGLKKWPPLRRFLFGAGAILVWLAVYSALFQAPAQDLEHRTIRMEAVVTQWPEETDYGVRVPVRAGEREGRKVSALFYGPADLADLRPGDRISCVARCTPAEELGGEESLYYPSQGILLRMKGYGQVMVTRGESSSVRYALTILAGKIRAMLDQLYPPREAGFLHALLTGDKTGLEETDRNNLNRVGLGHVVVVSGLHVTFLMGFLTLFLDPKKKGQLGLLLLILVLFCLMTGNGPGTVRATVLCAMALLAQQLGRDYHSLTGLCAALLVLLAANPYAAANAGLQFSFLSTLGILLFGQRWSKAWLAQVPKRARRLAAPFFGVAAISLGAMVFTVPLSAGYFGRFSLIAPLTNLMTSWAVTLAFVGGALSVAVGAVVFPLGQGLAALVGFPIRFFLGCAAQASRLGLASVDLDRGYYALWALFVYGVFLLYLLAPVPGKRPVVPVCACVVTLCLSALLTAKTVQRQDLALTVLDVGQGQSVVVTSGHARALIDCGGTRDPGDTAATYLQSLGRSELDLLILTHFHADHAGGVLELMDRVKVRALAVPDVDRDNPLRQEITARAAAENIPVYYVTETSQVTLGRAEITLYPPVTAGKDANEQCLSVLCARKGWEALLTGDMPAAAEAKLVARENLPEVEVLVAGHHGSKQSTSQALLEAVAPETVVISVGQNTYGHPAPETLARLSAAGAQVYRTDRQGGITVYAQSGEET